MAWCFLLNKYQICSNKYHVLWKRILQDVDNKPLCSYNIFSTGIATGYFILNSLTIKVKLLRRYNKFGGMI